MTVPETNFEVESATKTNDDAEQTPDGVTTSRWTDYGHDRLYINGLFTSTTDVYVDLDDDSVTVSGTQVRHTEAEHTDGGLVVTIERPSWTFEVKLTEVTGSEATDSDTEESTDTDSDSGVDLAQYGVDV